MAEVYLLDNRPLESAAIYRRMLDKPSQRQMGLAGLYRLALRSGRISAARNLLVQLADGGMPADRVVLEEVMLDLLEGRAEAALARLQDFMIEHRDLLRGWVLMAEAGLVLDDETAIRRALRRIEALEGTRGYYTSMIRGRMAFRANDFATAAELYEVALQHRPRSVALMEELLRLHLVLRNRSGAQKHMRALLHLDPDHAMALYVRGSLQIADGDYRLAEDSLRRSLASERMVMTLNDLAWLLARKGEYQEAEALAREGLEKHNAQATMWDTLGVILMRTGRLDEAEKALSRSVALDGTQPIVQLHMALLQVLRGRDDAARQITSQFEEYVDRFDDASLEIWTEIQDKL
jgi:Tfp pilus assembly protein PilF